VLADLVVFEMGGLGLVLADLVVFEMVWLGLVLFLLPKFGVTFQGAQMLKKGGLCLEMYCYMLCGGIFVMSPSVDWAHIFIVFWMVIL